MNRVRSGKMNANDGQKQKTGSSNYLSRVLNTIPDSIFVHDLNGKMFDVNAKALQILGCTREEALTRNIRDYWPADQPLIGYQPVLWEKVMEGEDQLFEWKVRRPLDGFVFDVEVSLAKLSLSQANLIVAVARDITARKRAEAEFTATRDLLLAILNNTYDAIYIHNPEGKIVEVNDRMLESHGAKSREEVIGLRIQDVSDPESPFDELKERWSKALANENQFFEWKCKRLTDGFLFPLEVYLTKVSLLGVDYILANVRDITERKNIENLLIKEKQTMFSVLEDNPHGIALINKDGIFTYVNPEFTRTTGYSLQDLPSWLAWTQKVYGTEESLERAVDRVEIQERITKLGHRIICKGGEHKHVESRITDLEESSLLVLTDVTAQREAEEALLS